jgi:ATP-dependent exoDNAse (exonuclease V) beta subunit
MIDNIFIKLEESFSDVIFLEKNHLYKINNGPALMSVSQIINNYEKPFDSKSIAEKVAKKRKCSIDDILKEWDFAKDYSCHKGSEFHRFVENFLARKQISLDIDSIKNFYDSRKFFLKDSSIEDYKNEMKEMIKNFIKFYNWWKKDHILLKSEFVIGDSESKICGTIDNLSFNKKTKQLVIFDYKTNKDIKMKNNYGEKLLNELSFLDKCEYTKYSLQLSLYSHILEKKTSFSVPTSYIVWVNAKENYDLIKCIDLKRESKIILNKFIK